MLQVVIGVPAIYLAYVKSIVPDTIGVAAQNCWKVPKGAFTGITYTICFSNLDHGSS